MLYKHTLTALTAAVLGFGVSAASYAASDYPSRPVTLVVPYAPGGPSDTAARILSQGLQEATGATFIVENSPGAGAIIGSGKVARAKPDGYTLLWGSKSSHVIAPHLRPDLAYHPFDSFDFVGMVGSQPYVVAVRSESPFKTVDDLVKEAKANSGNIYFSSPGVGSGPHLASELFALRTGIDTLHVPYKGGSPAMIAVLSGEVDFYLDTPTLPQAQAAADKARLLAISTAERSPDFPDVPTLKELGYADLDMKTWFGIVVPEGTSPEIVQWLNEKLNETLAQPRIVELLNNAGLDVETTTPEEFEEFVAAEHERWGKIITEADVTLE